MTAGAHLSVPDQRRATRHPVDHKLFGEHRTRGPLKLRIGNVSTTGFMICNAAGIARGDRVVIGLPVVGRIEGFCMWVADKRAGFHFERLIREDDFADMIAHLQPNPALRRRR